jgi:hypothetical protein
MKSATLVGSIKLASSAVGARYSGDYQAAASAAKSSNHSSAMPSKLCAQTSGWPASLWLWTSRRRPGIRADRPMDVLPVVEELRIDGIGPPADAVDQLDHQLLES